MVSPVPPSAFASQFPSVPVTTAHPAARATTSATLAPTVCPPIVSSPSLNCGAGADAPCPHADPSHCSRQASHTTSNSPHLSIAVINCGHGGLAVASDAVSDYGLSGGVDVLVLSEVHMEPGAPEFLQGYHLLWSPRPFGAASSRGGVALAVREASTTISDVTVLESCPRADVVWFQVTVPMAERPLYVAAVYLPPQDSQFVCVGCGTPSCPRSHVATALGYLADTTSRLAPDGDVVIAGDFNVRAQLGDLSPRWREVSETLLTTGALTVVNPIDGNGCFAPTRRDPVHGKESVLDLVLCPVPSATHPGQMRVLGVTIDTHAAISDHHVLLLHLSLAPVPPPTEVPDHYGFQSGVPHHLRQSLRVTRVVTEEVREGFISAVADALHSANVDSEDVVSSATALERAISTVAIRVGVCVGPRLRCATLKQAAKLQREAERLHTRLKRAIMLEQVAVVAQLCAQLDEVRRCQQLHLPARRKAQRERRAQRRAQLQSRLDGAWRHGDSGGLADQQADLQAGHLAVRLRRQHVPLRQLQAKLFRLATGMEEKYNRVPVIQPLDPNSPAAVMLDPNVQVSPDVASKYTQPPDRTEVQRAVKLLRGQASALGLPIRVLRWLGASSTLPFLHTFIRSIWTTGIIPPSFCVVRAVTLYKSGPRDAIGSYRIIGVGSALSRLFQIVLNERLMAQLTSVLSVSQYGFLAKRSTEHCIFLSNSAVACAQLEDDTAYTAYVDIAGAFGSLPHTVIHREMERYGVDAVTRSLLHTWYQQQRMFVQLGRLVSHVIPLTIGVTEGCVFSPICFITGIDTTIRRLQQQALVSNHRLGLRLIHNTVLSEMFFADDIWVASRTPDGLQEQMTVLGPSLLDAGLVPNCAPTKSAGAIHPGVSKAARAHHRAQPPPSFTLGGQDLPLVDRYKYLGVEQSIRGPTIARTAQLKRYSVKLAAIIRQACSAALRHISVLHGLMLYRTYWLPRVMYATGLYLLTVPPSFDHMESVVLRVMMAAPNHPLVVLRSITGLPTLLTRLNLDRVRVLVRLLSCAPESPVRQQLAIEVTTHARVRQSAHKKRLWWHTTQELLAVLDSVCDADFWTARNGVTLTSFTTWATAYAVAHTRPVKDAQAMHAAMRDALLLLESRRRQWELQRCEASLDEVRDLIDTPNMMPFLADTRHAHTKYRIQLCGGRRTLFGYQHFHVACCPWCNAPGQFSVPHLLRDCPASQHERVAMWTMAKDVLVAAGLCVDHNVCDHRQEWYRLTCGAAVSHKFVRLHLDAPTHFARPADTPATRHLRQHMFTYRRVLFLTGMYLELVVEGTRMRLDTMGDQLPHTDPQHKRRVTINHHTRELAGIAAAVVPHEPVLPVDHVVEPEHDGARDPPPLSPVDAVEPSTFVQSVWGPPPSSLAATVGRALAPLPSLHRTGSAGVDPVLESLLQWWECEEATVRAPSTTHGCVSPQSRAGVPLVSVPLSNSDLDGDDASDGDSVCVGAVNPNWMFEEADSSI